MPRLTTTAEVPSPQRKGYDFRINQFLFRSAVGPNRQMTIQSSPVNNEGVNVKQNPEDFTSNLGRIYSRNNFSGGSNLDRAHKTTGSPIDTTRFWDSKNIDVFHADEDNSYYASLLHTTESKQGLSGLNNYLVRTNNGYLYIADEQSVYQSTDEGATFNLMTSTNISQTIQGMVGYDNDLFVVTGDGSTNKQFLHYDLSADTWTDESLGTSFTGSFTGIFFAKGKLIVTGKSTTAHYLFATPASGHNVTDEFEVGDAIISDVETSHSFTDVADAGSVVLVSSTDGSIYKLKDNANTLELNGRTNLGFEEIHSVAAAEGIVFFGTKENTSNTGRMYKAQMSVADNLFVLVDRQLIKEWKTDVNSVPNFMVVTRDSVYTGVQESVNETNLWRYYLPTGGIARDLVVTHNDNSQNNKVTGIVQSGTTESKFVIAVQGSAVWKETSLYAAEGYIITSPADFFTAEKKQFVGALIECQELPSNGSIQLYASDRVDAINDPNHTSWSLQLEERTGDGGNEVQMQFVSRYITGKIVLKTTSGTDSPKLNSVQFRALARPELLLVQIPVNLSDRVERPFRKPINVKNLGETIYQSLKDMEGTSVTLELFDPAEVIRGVVEQIQYPINSTTEFGSQTHYAILTVRGTRQGTFAPVTSGNVFAVGKFAEMRFG